MNRNGADLGSFGSGKVLNLTGIGGYDNNCLSEVASESGRM